VISTEDIDDYGIQNVIQKIRDRVGMGPVYLRYDRDSESFPPFFFSS
jgi:agmatinase